MFENGLLGLFLAELLSSLTWDSLVFDLQIFKIKHFFGCSFGLVLLQSVEDSFSSLLHYGLSLVLGVFYTDPVLKACH